MFNLLGNMMGVKYHLLEKTTGYSIGEISFNES